MLRPLSRTAYAKHRRANGLTGGTLKAVQRAIQGGRITVDANGMIPDPEAADREWAANTDHSRAPGWVKDLADGEDEDGAARSKLSEASAREKHWKAELAELNYLERAGELVNAAEVQAEFADLCTTVRNKLLSLPNRMKQAYAGLTLEQLATLEQFIRQDLEELAA